MPRTPKKKPRAASPVTGEARIEFEPLSSLEKRYAPENAKLHDLDVIGESFTEHGLVDMPGVDEKSGLLFRGHGRVKKLAAMKAAGEEPPARVKVEGGDWLVPVVRGLSFKNREQFQKYLLVDNRATELGGWDNAALAKVLSKLDGDFVGTGFGETDLVRFMASTGASDKVKIEIKETFAIIVECKGERHQTELLRRFDKMGLKVRALVS